MLSNKKIGIALSGGGYRAAIYHLGTLKALNTLGILKNIDILSTISGGSITGASFCLHKGDFETFQEKMFEALTTKSVIRYVLLSRKFFRFSLFALFFLAPALALLFTQYAPLSIFILILFFYIVIKYQFKIFPVSEIIEKAYEKFFYSGAILSDLCDKPELAIGSTNLQTLRHFTFSKRKMEDSSYAYRVPPIYFDGKNFPVSRAVIASSCVPFAFTPITIDKIYYKDPNQFGIVDPRLVDGGVYDNQGAHKLTQKNSSYKCDIVIVSDAGNKLPLEGTYNNTFALLLRTVDTFMARIKHFQMIQNLYTKGDTAISFQSIGWDLDLCIKGFFDNLKNGNISEEICEFHELQVEWINNPIVFKMEIISHLEQRCNYEKLKANGLSKDQLKAIRKVGTNLTPIACELARNLIRHAEAITELQVRLYCPIKI